MYQNHFPQNNQNSQNQFQFQGSQQFHSNGGGFNSFQSQNQAPLNQASYAQRIENMHNKVFDHLPPTNFQNSFNPSQNQFGSQYPQQNQFGSPQNQFGSPQNQFGSQQNQFGSQPYPNQFNQNPSSHLPNQSFQQPTIPTYGGFSSPTWNPSPQNFGTPYSPFSGNNPFAGIPFNLQRSNFNHSFGYQEDPDAQNRRSKRRERKKPENNFPQYQQQTNIQPTQPEPTTPEHYEDEKEDDVPSDLLRISLIQSTFVKNPYYHDQEFVPFIENLEKKEDDAKKKIEEEARKAEEAKEKNRKNVFAFFSQQGTNFSQFILLLGNLKVSGELYVDKEFPANMQSLIGTNEMRKSEWRDVVWLRPSEFYGKGNFNVFLDGIEPCDIKQGQLGDCYFLSTISSLAEWPNRVRKIFATQQANECGLYSVKVCDMGEWKDVLLDDLFPCDKYTKKPIFTRGNDNELWVLILEKVWAKIYGSYDNIEAGLTRECLHDLTGGPTKFFLTDRREEWDILWKKLIAGEAKNYIMTCGAGEFFTSNNIVNITNSKGIVSSHAYSLLSAHEFTHQGQLVRLVKLRNPWGKTEWKGAWSDTSSNWTSELKARFKVVNKDDGIFYMPYEEFLKYFSDVQFCQVRDDYVYNAKKVNSGPHNAVYFKLTIPTGGKYYITVNQESKRKNSHNPYFKYSPVNIVVAKINGNGKYEHNTGNNRSDKEVWAKGTLVPGEYLVYAKVQWTNGKNNDFVLSTYGPDRAEIEVVQKSQYPGFLEETFITKALKSDKKNSYAREGEANCYSIVDITRDGFIFCFYRNNSTRTLETEVYFKEFKGIKLRKPYRGREFSLSVPPNQERIVLLKILPNEDVRQVLSEKVRFVKASGGDSYPSYPSYPSTGTGGGGVPTYPSSTAKIPNLDNEAREQGQMKRVKDSAGNFTQIFIYQYQYDSGIYLLFENKTSDSVLDEKLICELQGLEPIGKEGQREIRFEVYPGNSSRLAFKTTGAGTVSARFKYESVVKRLY